MRRLAELCRGRARAQEPVGTKPVVATKNPEWRQRWFERLREFHDSYEEALRRYRQGEHDTVFPEGTYQMRVLFGVRCDRRFSGGEAGVAATGPPRF